MSAVKCVVVIDSRSLSARIWPRIIDAYLKRTLSLLQETLTGQILQCAYLITLPTSLYNNYPFKASSFKPLPDFIATLPALADYKGKGKACVNKAAQLPLLDAFIIATEMLELDKGPHHIILVSNSDLECTAFENITDVAVMPPDYPRYSSKQENDQMNWLTLAQSFKAKDVKFSLIATAFIPRIESFWRMVQLNPQQDLKPIPILNQEHVVLLAFLRSGNKAASAKRSNDELASSISGNPLKRQRTESSNVGSPAPSYASPLLVGATISNEPQTYPQAASQNQAQPSQMAQSIQQMINQPPEVLLKLIEQQVASGKMSQADAARVINQIKANHAQTLRAQQPQAQLSTMPNISTQNRAVQQPIYWSGSLTRHVFDQTNQRVKMECAVIAAQPAPALAQELTLFTWPRSLDLDNLISTDIQALQLFVQQNRIPAISLLPVTQEMFNQGKVPPNLTFRAHNETLFISLAKDMQAKSKVAWTFMGPLRGNGILTIAVPEQRIAVLIFHRIALPDVYLQNAQ